jgi:hypothetical protein
MVSFEIDSDEIVRTVDEVLHEHDVTADRDVYVPGDRGEMAVLVAFWGEFARPEILAIEQDILERVDPDAVAPGQGHVAVQVAHAVAIRADEWSRLHGSDEGAKQIS